MNYNELGRMRVSDLISMRNKKVSQVVSKRSSISQRKMNIANSIHMNQALAEKKKVAFREGMLKSTNTMMYPYLLQTENLEIVPSQKGVSKITVNGEASMIVTHYSRTIFKLIDAGAVGIIPQFIKPDDYTIDGEIRNLKVLMNDLSSGRTYTPQAISLQGFGHAQEPTAFEETLYLDPNKSIEIIFDNQDLVETYYCSMMFFGFRLSIEDANHMFNQVTVSV